MYKQLVIVLSAGWFSFSGLATDFYVSPSGSNAASGAVSDPFQTIQHAFDVAGAGDTIYVREGTYRETVTLVSKSGSKGSLIRLTAYPEETPVISGLDLCDDLTWVATQGVYVASYTNGSFDQLFFDGQPMLEARWPNTPTNELGEWDFFSPDVWADVDSSGNFYGTVKDSDLAATGWNVTGSRVVLNVDHQFYCWSRTVESHTVGSSTFTYPTNLGSSVDSGDETGSTPSFNDDRYYLVGELDYLDSPGEWVLDTANHLLYFYPPAGKNPNSTPVEIKQRVWGIDADENSSYLTVDGLTFWGTAFRFGRNQRNCSSNISLLNNQVLHASWTEYFNMPAGDAHRLDEEERPTVYAHNSHVIGNTFAFGAMNGLFISGWDNLIENNLFYDLDYNSSLKYPPLAVSRNWAVYEGYAGRATVRYNTLYNSGGILLQVGQGSNDVYLNYLYGAFLSCWGGNKDVAALYTLSTYVEGSRFHHNWIHDGYAATVPVGWGRGIGIRGDDSTAGLTIDHNVIWNFGSAGIMIKNPTNPTPAQANACCNNSVFYHSQLNNTKSAIIIRTKLDEENLRSTVANNLADSISGDWYAEPLGTVALCCSNSIGILSETKMENIDCFDFRPLDWATEIIDCGVTVSGLTETVVGIAPDIGAYERGNSTYWIPGQRAETADFPIVPDGTQNVPASRDVLMWRPAYGTVSNHVYFGTSFAAVQAATPANSEYQGTLTGETNVFNLPVLSGNQTYYWRVDAVKSNTTVASGPVWSFSTDTDLRTTLLLKNNPGDTPGDALAATGSVYFGAVTLSATASADDLPAVFSGWNSLGVNSRGAGEYYEEIESAFNEVLTLTIDLDKREASRLLFTGVELRNVNASGDRAVMQINGEEILISSNSWTPAHAIVLLDGDVIEFTAENSFGIVSMYFEEVPFIPSDPVTAVLNLKNQPDDTAGDNLYSFGATVFSDVTLAASASATTNCEVFSGWNSLGINILKGIGDDYEEVESSFNELLTFTVYYDPQEVYSVTLKEIVFVNNGSSGDRAVVTVGGTTNYIDTVSWEPSGGIALASGDTISISAENSCGIESMVYDVVSIQ